MTDDEKPCVPCRPVLPCRPNHDPRPRRMKSSPSASWVKKSATSKPIPPAPTMATAPHRHAPLQHVHVAHNFDGRFQNVRARGSHTGGDNDLSKPSSAAVWPFQKPNLNAEVFHLGGKMANRFVELRLAECFGKQVSAQASHLEHHICRWRVQRLHSSCGTSSQNGNALARQCRTQRTAACLRRLICVASSVPYPP